jgi:hypothetical protein
MRPTKRTRRRDEVPPQTCVRGGIKDPHRRHPLIISKLTGHTVGRIRDHGRRTLNLYRRQNTRPGEHQPDKEIPKRLSGKHNRTILLCVVARDAYVRKGTRSIMAPAKLPFTVYQAG